VPGFPDGEKPHRVRHRRSDIVWRPATPSDSAQVTPTSTGVRPNQLIWLFGFARSGTTWLASMMNDLPDHHLWDEPYVGALFGEFYDFYNGSQQGQNFILGQPHRSVWLQSISSMILEGARARYPGLSAGGHVVIKEPHGSIGAPLVLEALPQSRCLLVIRDPRDVVASNLDSQRRNSWSTQTNQWKNRRRPPSIADTNPDAAVEQLATSYVRQMGAAWDAYHAHDGPKALVKYEELRQNTLQVMWETCTKLDLELSEGILSRTVERHSWDNIPAAEKGPGRFYRKGTPGGWKDDLTQDQAKTVETITRPVFDACKAANA
jgi:Sulfotransferase domain